MPWDEATKKILCILVSEVERLMEPSNFKYAWLRQKKRLRRQDIETLQIIAAKLSTEALLQTTQSLCSTLEPPCEPDQVFHLVFKLLSLQLQAETNSLAIQAAASARKKRLHEWNGREKLARIISFLPLLTPRHVIQDNIVKGIKQH